MEIRRLSAPAFEVCGRGVFITGQDNAQFGRFWEECHANGLIDRLSAIYSKRASTITNSRAIGVSRVERDPSVRAFDFYIATECGGAQIDADLARFTIPACDWAIFRNEGELPLSLVESEIYAMTKWLPESGETHARAPELEVYPDARGDRGVITEFWLPLRLI